MALEDPTNGTGYPQRAKLPSAHMTTIALNQSKALDKQGTDTLSGTTTVTGAIALGADGRFRLRPAADAGTSSLTVDADNDVTVFNGSIGAGFNVDLPIGPEIPDQGGTIKRVANDTGSAMTLRDNGNTVAVVPDGACVELYFSNGRDGWFVSGYSGSVTSPRF